MLSIRMPAVLKARVRAEADKQGVKLAEFVAEACRMRLDGDVAQSVEPKGGQTAYAGSSSAVFTTACYWCGPIDPSKSHMCSPIPQSLRDICAEKVAGDMPKGYKLSVGDDPIIEVEFCGQTWWDGGEQYECLMAAGHREAHGLRGMVRKLDA